MCVLQISIDSIYLQGNVGRCGAHGHFDIFMQLIGQQSTKNRQIHCSASMANQTEPNVWLCGCVCALACNFNIFTCNFARKRQQAQRRWMKACACTRSNDTNVRIKMQIVFIHQAHPMQFNLFIWTCSLYNFFLFLLCLFLLLHQ